MQAEAAQEEAAQNKLKDKKMRLRMQQKIFDKEKKVASLRVASAYLAHADSTSHGCGHISSFRCYPDLSLGAA